MIETNHRLVDLDAERAVLGAVIVDPGVLPGLRILSADDFSTPKHAEIWRAFTSLRDLGDPIDTLTLTSLLRGAGALATVGGPAYLAELEGTVPTTANAVAYAEIVHDLAERRLQLEQLRTRQAQLDDLSVPVDPSRRSTVVRLGDALDNAMGLFERRHDGTERPLPLPWSGVAKALGGGLWPGAHVVTGTTAAGKTAFALQVALAAAYSGHPVLYIGLELDTSQIVARLASLVLGNAEGRPVAHWSDIYLGKTDPRITAPAIESLREFPLYVEEAPPGGWSSRNLRTRVEELKTAPERRTGVAADPSVAPLVVLDFLQLVGPTDPGGRREELRERIGAAAYAGREVARRCGAVVLMISSISRAGASDLLRLGEEEQLGVSDPADLVGLGKESGDIEFSADSVLVLAREPRNDATSSAASPVPVWLAIAKQRAGRASWALLRFNGSWLEEDTTQQNHAQARSDARDAARAAAQQARSEQEREEGVRLVVEAIRQAREPLSKRALRDAVPRRAAIVDAGLAEASTRGMIRHDLKGWVLADSGAGGAGSEGLSRAFETPEPGAVQSPKQTEITPTVSGVSRACPERVPDTQETPVSVCPVFSVGESGRKRDTVGGGVGHDLGAVDSGHGRTSDEAPASKPASKRNASTPKLSPEERARLLALPPTDEYLEAMVARVEADSRAEAVATEVPAASHADAIRAAVASGDDAALAELTGQPVPATEPEDA